MGALPLLGLYHSATGGGLLADLPSMACFCVKCDHRRIFQGGSHEAPTSRVKKILKLSWHVVFTDAWIYEEDLLLADSKKAIFTLAPHVKFHPTHKEKRFLGFSSMGRHISFHHCNANNNGLQEIIYTAKLSRSNTFVPYLSSSVTVCVTQS